MNLNNLFFEFFSAIGDVAKELLDLIIREANELLRKKDLRESSDAINFLTTELSKSSLISMKDAMNELVQSKLEMQMMAKINPDYILKIADPPYIPEEKSGPARAIICISLTFASRTFAMLHAYIYIKVNRKLFRYCLDYVFLIICRSKRIPTLSFFMNAGIRMVHPLVG